MKTLREAAEIALMALEHPNFQGAEEAERLLRSALEQQAKHAETYDSLERYTQEIRTILANSAKSEPLTDQEILNVWKPFEGNPFTTKYEFARAIERAHGIGGKE